MEGSVRNVVLLSQLTLSCQLDPPGAAGRAEIRAEALYTDTLAAGKAGPLRP